MQIHNSAASDVDLGLLTADHKSPVPNAKRPKSKRFTLDLTAAQHRLLKGGAVKAGLTMRTLVLQLLHREGLLGDTSLEEALHGPDPDPNEETSKG